MIDKLKNWFIGVAAGLVALGYILLQRRTAQRDKARKEKQTAEHNQRATEKQQERTQDVTQAQNGARHANAKAAEERNSQSDSERRTGRLSGFDRVRARDSQD